MIGGIIGDMIGSRFEGMKVLFDANGNPAKFSKQACTRDVVNPKYTELSLAQATLFPDYVSFTDDTVLMVATAKALMTDMDFKREYVNYFEMFSEQNAFYSGPGIGYGSMFMEWAIHDHEKGIKRRPYGSFGNGSAMRVHPCIYYAKSLSEVASLSVLSAQCTHNHPKGIEGAMVFSMIAYLAKSGFTATDIQQELPFITTYSFDFTLEQLIANYGFVPTCEGSVPQAIFLALKGPDFETVMINCLKIGGDTDTIACMAGEIAYHLYGAPQQYVDTACKILGRDGPLLLDMINSFYDRFAIDINVGTKTADKPNDPIGLFARLLKRVGVQRV